MTAQETVQALRCCAEGECKGCVMHEDTQRCQENLLDKAAEAIERLTAEKVPQWTSVKERRPEPGTRVLATDGVFVGEAYRGKSGEWRRYDDCLCWFDVTSQAVTHWMPLPGAPEEIKAPFTEDAMINLAAQALGVEPSRLRELAEADKDGRCVVLPCKVGDMVYFVNAKHILEFTVVGYAVDETGISWVYSEHVDKTGHTHERTFSPDRIGKTTFLSREEAEKAMKGETEK